MVLSAANAQFRLERLRRRGIVRLFAMRTQHADEALREHGFERRGDEIRLDAHVHEPGERAGRVVGVQRGENQVAGERRLHRDLRGFGVANFADENHVRVVAQNRAQPARERQAGFFVDLNLIDALELIFHRIFHRDDFADGVVDFVQRGVKRRGFAGTGRAGDQNNSVRQTAARFGNVPARACSCRFRQGRAAWNFAAANASRPLRRAASESRKRGCPPRRCRCAP